MQIDSVFICWSHVKLKKLHLLGFQMWVHFLKKYEAHDNTGFGGQGQHRDGGA